MNHRAKRRPAVPVLILDLALDLALVLALAATGCREASEVGPRSVGADLSPVRRALVVRREQLSALVDDQLGIWRSLWRQRRILTMFRVYERIPVGPGRDRLEHAIKEMARDSGFASARVTMTEAGPPPPVMPETVDTPGGPRFDPDGVAGALDLRVELEPADLGAAESFVARMKRAGSRMIVPLDVDVSGGGVVVHARAWYFHDIEPPRAVVRVPDLDEELAAAAIDPTVAQDPDTLFRMVDLVRLHGDIEVLGALAGPVAQDLARSNLLAARFDFYKRHERMGAKVRFSDLLDE